jgi:phosphatidylglycerol:prolipoprotein diacylglycerol transferase
MGSSALSEGLVVTHWFDPAPYPRTHSVTIRFYGTRQGVAGKPEPADRFVHDETVEGILADGGPVSVTARVTDINPGDWMVTSEMRPARAEKSSRRQPRAQPSPQPTYPAAWSWRRWALVRAPKASLKTGLIAFAFIRIPSVIPGIYASLATAGMLLGLTVQAVLVSRAGLRVLPILALSTVAVLVGFAGAKAWFVVINRRQRRLDGWCIQGFLSGFLIAAAVGLLVVRVPFGVYLDVSAPGLLLGMSVGRVGCFFAGCCYGRPTASRWGVWSSDQRVGQRRVPTQLMESGLALAVGLGALVALLRFGPSHGTILVAALALYTACRQGILRWRGERRQSSWGGLVTAATAAAVLVADVALFVLRPPWLP